MPNQASSIVQNHFSPFCLVIQQLNFSILHYILHAFSIPKRSQMMYNTWLIFQIGNNALAYYAKKQYAKKKYANSSH